MSFPNPQYIKSFINEKLTKKENETTSLIGENKQSETTYGLEEVKVTKSVPSDGSLTPDSNEDDHHHNLKHRQSRKSNRHYRGSASSSLSPNRDTATKSTSENKSHSHENTHNGYGTTELSNGTRTYGGSSSKDKTKLPPDSRTTRGLGYSKGGENKGYQRDGDDNDDHVGHGHSHDQSHAHGHDHDHKHEDESDESFESDHCHDESTLKEQKTISKRNKALKKLIIATILSAIFMCGEVLGGYLASSLAIMTDASHLLTDVSSFLISIIALKMAAKPSSKKMTFGWHRAEVIGAIISVFAIWVVTGILVYLAVMRLIKDDYELDGKTMLITAACAVGFNILMGLVLHEAHGHSHAGHSHGHSHGHDHSHGEHSHSHSGTSTPKSTGSTGSLNLDDDEPSGNVNVRAAFIHVLGDLLQSLGVLVAAFIIYFKPEYKIADPICTFFFSILVLITTFTILRDTVVIIMEGSPAGIEFSVVKEKLLAIEGVVAIHDLRIWSLTLNQSVLSCHLAIDKNMNSTAILKKATKMLKNSYDFHSMTIQIEKYSVDMDDCSKCK